MNYATVVHELFSRFPKLKAAYHAEFAYMGNEEPGQYIVFGSILIPALTTALENGDLGTILPICAFLEDVSPAAGHDDALEALLKVEVAEWLGWAANEERLAPWLGTETKRICNYVPGLATQRIQLRSEEKANTIPAKSGGKNSLKLRTTPFCVRLMPLQAESHFIRGEGVILIAFQTSQIPTAAKIGPATRPPGPSPTGLARPASIRQSWPNETRPTRVMTNAATIQIHLSSSPMAISYI